jgi:hypothetical protein
VDRVDAGARRRVTATARCALIVALLAPIGCHHDEGGPCQRALARLDRIEQARPPRVHPSALGRALMRDACRGRAWQYDPAIGCAVAGPTDEAAAACIDRFVHDVVRPAPGAHPGTAPHDGRGVNPLIEVDGE